MAEQRKKSDSILLRTEGKTISLELFPSDEWPEENGGEGLFRVRINGVWYCPTGKYSFLSVPAIGELVSALLNNGEAPKEESPPFLPYKAEVKVYIEDRPEVSRGWVYAAPHQERDGRWYAWVWVSGGPRKLCVNDVTLHRVI